MITARQMAVLERLAKAVRRTTFDRIERVEDGWTIWSAWSLLRTPRGVELLLGGRPTAHQPDLTPSRRSLATMQAGAILHVLLREADGRDLVAAARTVMSQHADRLVVDAIDQARDEGRTGDIDANAGAYAYHQLGAFTATLSRWARNRLSMHETMLRAFLIRTAMGCPNVRSSLGDDYDQRMGEAFGRQLEPFDAMICDMIDGDARMIAHHAFDRPTIQQTAVIAHGMDALRRDVPRSLWIAACGLDAEEMPDILALIRHEHVRLQEMEEVGLLPVGSAAWIAAAGPAAYYAARPGFEIATVPGILDVDPLTPPIGAFMYGEASLLRSDRFPQLLADSSESDDPSMQMVVAAVLRENVPTQGDTWDEVYESTFGFMSNEPSTEGQDVDYEDEMRVVYIVLDPVLLDLELRAMAIGHEQDGDDDDHHVTIVYHDGRRRLVVVACTEDGHVVREMIDGFACAFKEAESAIDGQIAMQVLHVG